ncbi:hypothetical protein PIB30_077689 [Stylosanthes scabra]|uniref:Uncharacterized protein n=1 Tax=Stylosanthes scabra TaxID=79078 RepID=A0ABU6UPD3_9FABA|nr:hypothetical protein [Stylosanthes scabra]
MIDALSRCALMNKIPDEAWELIESVADNSEHFKTRAATSTKGVLNSITAAPKQAVYAQPQGWCDNQQNRWNSFKQPQQTQYRQPYTYSQPQNPQNLIYQPPHICQTYPQNPQANVIPTNYEEALCTSQQENRDLREALKRGET